MKFAEFAAENNSTHSPDDPLSGEPGGVSPRILRRGIGFQPVIDLEAHPTESRGLRRRARRNNYFCART